MQVIYARDRFTDAGPARIALDTDISIVAVNPERLSCPPRADSLPWAVFEYKGREYTVQSSKECRIWLLDTSAMGGEDHRTPTFRTPLVFAP